MSYDFGEIPPHLHAGLDRWLRHGVLPGGFLRAVISNHLLLSILRADEQSLAGLPALARWLYTNAPEGSFGSPAVLETWPLYLAALERQAEAAAREIDI